MRRADDIEHPAHPDHPEHGSHVAAKSRHWRTGLVTTAAVMTALTIISTPIWRWVAKPILVGAVTLAVAEDLEAQVQQAVAAAVAPVERKVQAGNAGLKAIIAGNITGLENDISRLEYVRDQPPAGDWTDEHRRELLGKHRALATQRGALEQILEAEEPDPD